MPKFNYMQNAFNYGQVSQKLFGRTDIKEYAQGCKRIENMLVQPQGGAERRPGTVFLHDLALTKEPVILPFKNGGKSFILCILSADDSAIGIEVRVFRTDADEACPERVNVVPFSDVAGRPGPADNGLSLTGYSYAQVGPFMFIIHESGQQQPILIQRDEALSGTIGEWWIGPIDNYINRNTTFDMWKFFPYESVNATATQLEFNGTLLSSNTPEFTSSSIGRIYRLTAAGNEAFVLVTGYTNNQTASADLLHGTASAGTYTGTWSRSLWSSGNYPFSVTGYQRRLFFGGCPESSDTLSASRVYNAFDFLDDFVYGDTTEEKASDPFQDIIGYEDYDKIRWLQGGAALHVGTDLAEFSLHGTLAANSATDPDTMRDVRKYTAIGSRSSKSEIVDNMVIFVDKSGVRLSGLKFSDEVNGFSRVPLSNLNPDILYYEGIQSTLEGQQFSQMVWDNARRILWLRDSKSKVFGVTIDVTSSTTAWGSFDYGSVCNLVRSTNTDGITSIVFLVARDGGYYLERSPMAFEGEDLSSAEALGAINYDRSVPYFSDSALALTGTAQTVWAVNHLANEFVTYLLDGFVGSGTVDGSGNLTTAPGARLIVGLPYISVIETNPLSTNGYYGPTVDSIQRVSEVVLNLYRTWRLDVGKVVKASDKVYPCKITENFTGQHSMKTPNGFSRGETIVMKTDSPLPWGISSLLLKGVAND